MPRVPELDLPSVSPSAGQMPMYSAPDSPDIAGKQLQEQGKHQMAAGVQLIKMQRYLQAEQDDAATKELDNQLAEQFRTVLYDKDSGYLAKNGKDAATGREAISSDLTKIRDDLLAKAGNDTQKQMLAQVSGKRLEAAMMHVDGHAMHQTFVWKENESISRIKSSVADAVTNSVSWQMADQEGAATGPFNTAKATATQEAMDVAKLRGYDTAQTKQFVSEVQAGLHGTVLSNMVSLGQSNSARDYLEKFAPEIAAGAPDKLDNLRGMVKQAGIKDDSLNLSFSLKGGLQQQIGAVDEMFKKGAISAEVRDATVQRVEHNYQQRKAQQDEGNKAAMGQSQEWVLKNPGKSIMDMPPNLYSWAKNNGHLMGLDSFAQREGRPGERISELKVRGELLGLAGADPDAFIAEFKKSGFSDRFDLGATGIKEMQTIAGNMISGTGKYHATFDNKILQDAIPGSILKDKDKKDAFVAIMAEEGDKWRKANPGKVPDQSAYQQVTQAANKEWISVGSIWNSTTPAYRARGKENAVPKDFFEGMKASGATEAETIMAWRIKNGKK